MCVSLLLVPVFTDVEERALLAGAMGVWFTSLWVPLYESLPDHYNPRQYFF